jgi:exodeoxyribonuclease VII large subunit
MAVPVRTDLLAAVGDLAARLARSGAAAVALRRQRVSDLGRALPRPGRLTALAAQRLDQAGTRLQGALAGVAARKRVRLADIALRPALLLRRKGEDRRRLDALALRLSPDLAAARLLRARAKLAALERLRLTLGYEATLRRGFAVVRGDGHVVGTVGAAAAAASLEVQFADGRLAVSATAAAGAADPAGAARPRRKPARPAPPGQGSLL